MKIHNKLVRDRIPEIIEKAGKKPVTHILSDEEYITELDRKLNEECAEYQTDKSIEELADMLEVIYAVAEARGWSESELEAVRADKAEKRGIFKDRIYLELFHEDEFGYLIIDEAHHASAETYQKVLAYFRPQFTLGLTATPDRTDEKDIIEIFKNTAHKLDIQTAVEIDELVPVRCIRIHTNIDLTKVRFNSIQYNIRDLESKIFVPERNTLIVDTFMEYVSDKRTVIFCASVKHAEQIADMIRECGVNAVSVSGSKFDKYIAIYPIVHDYLKLIEVNDIHCRVVNI